MSHHDAATIVFRSFYRATNVRAAHAVFRDFIANYTSDNPPWNESTLENYKGTAIYQKGDLFWENGMSIFYYKKKS